MTVALRVEHSHPCDDSTHSDLVHTHTVVPDTTHSHHCGSVGVTLEYAEAEIRQLNEIERRIQ